MLTIAKVYRGVNRLLGKNAGCGKWGGWRVRGVRVREARREARRGDTSGAHDHGVRRREPGGPAAKHRALPQRGTSVGRGEGTRVVRTTTGCGGAMRTSRPTAKPQEGMRVWCTRGDTSGAHDHGARRRDRDIAPYRNGARAWGTRREARRGAWRGGARLRNMPRNGLFHGPRDRTEPWRRKTTAKGMGFGDE